MILVDTSIWADHFRVTDALLSAHLSRQLILLHPFVIGELAMGHLRPRAAILRSLQAAPQAPVAAYAEVLELIEDEDLIAIGIGYVDAHLLASVSLTEGARLWTRDRRLHAAASRLGRAFANS